MTKEEFCDWLKTAKNGSKIKRIETNSYFEFDGLYFNGMFTLEKFLIDVVFINPEFYEIVKMPRKREFLIAYSEDERNTIFEGREVGHVVTSLYSLCPDVGSSVSIKITIEEIFE